MDVNIFVIIATHVGAFGLGFHFGMDITKKLVQRRLDKLQKDLSQKTK